MSECGFWFWFVRPMAEMLGGLAIVFAFAAIGGPILWLLTRGKK